jgi:drug/metabolite transporter (DMT)-like permease
VGGVTASLLTYAISAALTLIVQPSGFSRMRAQPGWALAIALCAGWTNLAYVLAVLKGDIVRVLLLFYLAPLWTVPLARLLLGERLGRWGSAAVASALAGAAFTLWKPGAGLPVPRDAADWLGLSAGLGFALTNVATRAARGLALGAKVLAPALGVIVLAAGWLAWRGDGPMPEVASAPTVALIGGTGLALAGIAMAVQYGVTHVKANVAIVVMLFEIVVGAASSAWIAGERITYAEAVGALLIVGASLLAVRGEQG